MIPDSGLSASSVSKSPDAPPPGGWPKPSVTVDLVLFAWNPASGSFETLLIERGRPPFAGSWAIPGGFLDLDEEPEAAASRELVEETGVSLTRPPEFLGVYAKVNRDPRGRTISLAYVELVDPRPEPLAGDDAHKARWWCLDRLPESLAFDHDQILADARRWLKNRLPDRTPQRAALENWPPQRFEVAEVARWFRAAGITRPAETARRWLHTGFRDGTLQRDTEHETKVRRVPPSDDNQ